MRPLAGTAATRTIEGPPWSDGAFLAIAGLSLALKLALAFGAVGTAPVLDEQSYLTLARSLAAGEGFPSNFRPPLYPALLATSIALLGGPEPVRFVQALLATFCLLPVYRLAQGIGGRGSARLAAGLVAFDPVLTGFSHLLWSETLYLSLLLPCLALLASDPRARRGGRWLAAGLLLGLAGLARAQALTLAPLLVLWAWLERDPGRGWLRGSALLALGACLALLPWAGRNLVASGQLVLVDTNAAYNALLATDPRARFVDKDDAWSAAWGSLDGEAYLLAAARDPGAAQRRALALAGRRIAADPAGFAAKSLWEAGHLFTLDDFIARHLRNGWYGPGAPAWLTPGYAILAALASAFLMLAGGLGLAAQPPSPFRRLATLALLHSVLLFGLAFSLSRHALPLRPLLAVAAAWLVLHPAAVAARLRTRSPSTAAAALLVLALLFAWSRDLPLLRDMASDGGAAHRFHTLR